jgi:hypothetical protein
MSILVAGLFLMFAGRFPVASEDRFREEHRDHGGGGGGAGISLGITLGTELLKHGKKPEAPGSGTVKTTAKKGDPPKKPPKKENPKAPPPEEKPKEETDCVLYMHYTIERKPPAASNEDMKNSAKALREKLAQDAKKKAEDIPMEEVNSKTTIEQALDKIAAKGKCCKTLHIVSHGSGTGQLDLPYDLPDKKGELNKKDKEDQVEHWIGGPPAKAGWAADRLDDLVKKLKERVCKGGSVAFDACDAGKEGGIAEQIAGKGIPTSGFPGYCEMGPKVKEGNEKDKQYLPPRPGEDEHASDPPKSFEATPQPEKPKPAEKPQKK